MKESKDIKFLLKYFHKIGHALNFEEAALGNTVFLDPNWITRAIYDVLSDKAVIKKDGTFHRDDLYRHWQNKECNETHKECYTESECNYLLNLMLKDGFDICYALEGKPGRYVVPMKLPDKQPAYSWDQADNLHFRFQYPFMPEGMLSRLIVRLNEYVRENKAWLSGALFNLEDCIAEVQQHETTLEGVKFIGIRISGNIREKRRDALKIIRFQISHIHKTTFPYITISNMIGCNCSVCQRKEEPNFYNEEDIKNHLEGKKTKIFCTVSKQDVEIGKLVGEVYSLEDIQEKSEILELLRSIKRDIEEIKNAQWEIIDHFEKSEKRIIHSVISEFNLSQTRQVETLLSELKPSEIDTNYTDKSQADELIKIILKKLEDIDISSKSEIREKLENELSTGARLKFSIPIIPLILSYESHVGFDSYQQINSWRDLLPWLRDKKKQEPTPGEVK